MATDRGGPAERGSEYTVKYLFKSKPGSLDIFSDSEVNKH